MHAGNVKNGIWDVKVGLWYLTPSAGKVILTKRIYCEKEGNGMLRIAICDDEVRARDALWMQLEKLLREGSEEVVYDFS